MIPHGSPVHLPKFGKVEQAFQIVIDGQESDVLKRHFPVGHHSLEYHAEFLGLFTDAKQVWSPIDSLFWMLHHNRCYIKNLRHNLRTHHRIDATVIEVLLGITEQSGILECLTVEPLRGEDACRGDFGIGIMVEDLLHVLVIHQLRCRLCRVCSCHRRRGLDVDIDTIPTASSHSERSHQHNYGNYPLSKYSTNKILHRGSKFFTFHL